MTFVEQVWGTPNERIHTVGTIALALSLGAFLILQPLNKMDGLLVFYLFSSGCAFIGYATSRNAWTRWRTGEDTLILLRKRGTDTPEHSVELHIFGRILRWTGRVAHVDVGRFSITQAPAGTPIPAQSTMRRSYQMFRAIYWAICSSIAFQATFGLMALIYGTWLMTVVFEYMMSNA